MLKHTLLSLCLALCGGLVSAQPVDVLPAQTKENTQSLNGVWSFKYLEGSELGGDAGFSEPTFDVSSWKTIPVPSHWELQGFAEPQYADDVKEGFGLYRRTFSLPESWKEKRVFLRFDGVLYGFTAYVNGKAVGGWASGFNTSTFDITDALQPGENQIAVRVTTRSKGWEFDNMDCWALSGIYRDVTLFALPRHHLKDYTSRTTLNADGSATLALDFVATATGTVSGTLTSPDGKTTETFNVSLSPDGLGSTRIEIPRPQLWTAESPFLYQLAFTLESEGKARQTHTTRVGLRQVTIEDGILKLNGTPIKLRGVNHHEIWPEGRVSTEENTRRDLELIREANINFVRTAHYPPHPRLLEICDEMGFYVLNEVPFVHGRHHLKDKNYQDVLYTRARATVSRDKNHPCILFWSIGNENPVNRLSFNTGKLVKELDPTRPIMFPTVGSHFAQHYEKFPEYADIYAPHYPASRKVREYAETLTRPIIFTEYAHQRGLARAGTNVQDLWEKFYQSPRIAGGAVWVFQDQGLLRRTDDMKSVPDYDLMAWIDEHRYYDTRGFFAMDGLVYSDRTPQTDYWLIRKVYSPVQIKENEIPITPGKQTLSFHLENRHDFRTLEGFKLKWSLLKNRTPLQTGELSPKTLPKATDTLTIKADLPETLGTDVFTLELRCYNEKGGQCYERTIRLQPDIAPDSRWNALTKTLQKSSPQLEITDALIAVTAPDYRIKLDRIHGGFSLRDAKGSEIVSAIGPHTGRNPTINDMAKNRERLPDLWQGRLLTEVSDLKTAAVQTEEGIEITVSGVYPRPSKPEEAVEGEYKLKISPSGAIQVAYRYVPVNGTGEMLEAGFAMALPASCSEFRWLGLGPYAAYPGKDRLSEYGIHHLNREDLYFPGNRRQVELAAFSTPSGTGVLLGGPGMTLDLENTENATVLSHVGLVPGDKSTNESGENVSVSSKLRVSSIKAIQGSFNLLTLNAQWPSSLESWLGSPMEKSAPRKPFLRSYDQ
ncbi:MAG: glycoside hydrolase family 2 TIM barrel-domain containing protein [Luteolibacter sp.]